MPDSARQLDLLLKVFNGGWTHLGQAMEERGAKDAEISVEDAGPIADAVEDLFAGRGFSFAQLGDRPIFHALHYLGLVVEGGADLSDTMATQAVLELASDFFLGACHKQLDASPDTALSAKYMGFYRKVFLLAKIIQTIDPSGGSTLSFDEIAMEWKVGEPKAQAAALQLVPIPRILGWADLETPLFQTDVLLPLINHFAKMRGLAFDSDLRDRKAFFICITCNQIRSAIDRNQESDACTVCTDDFDRAMREADAEVGDYWPGPPMPLDW